jgi:hypothetical protein
MRTFGLKAKSEVVTKSLLDLLKDLNFATFNIFTQDISQYGPEREAYANHEKEKSVGKCLIVRCCNC